MKYFGKIILLSGLLVVVILASVQFSQAQVVYSQSSGDLPVPWITPGEGGVHAFSDPFPIVVDFRVLPSGGEVQGDVVLTLATLDGVDVLDNAVTTDGRRWRISIPNIRPGQHTFVVDARDEGGSTFAAPVEITFRVLSPPAFRLELLPGWNLISFPANPNNPAIDAVFRPDTPVSTVHSFDPNAPGGWLTASRLRIGNRIFGPFLGDLRTIDSSHAYWVFSEGQDEIGVVLTENDSSSPVTPRAIRIHQGWNLVPVIDTSGSLDQGDVIDADVYFASLDEEISRITTFDAITGQTTLVILDGISEPGTQEELTRQGVPGACATCPLGQNERIEVGKGYWVFSTEAGTLVP